MNREKFKLAFVRNLIDAGLGEPEHLEAMTDLVLAGMDGEPVKQAGIASTVWDLVRSVPGAARTALTDYLAPAAKYTTLGAVSLPVAAVGTGLGIGALSGAIRSSAEALDDDTEEDLQREDVASHYGRLADAAEARARTIAFSKRQQARRGGRPVL